ncbi:MAG TPA: MerR family transcriptional regulator, partial [Massilia timonae]|nr:MerR family transcriptional regulator [Massilia timonae]
HMECPTFKRLLAAAGSRALERRHRLATSLARRPSSPE